MHTYAQTRVRIAELPPPAPSGCGHAQMLLAVPSCTSRVGQERRKERQAAGHAFARVFLRNGRWLVRCFAVRG
eukprot:4842978-Alexandrium_andersonii.AAC.1